MFVSKFQLHLYPVDSNLIVSNNALVKRLTEIAFIGEIEKNPLDKYEKRYLTGDKFLSYLCFLGCSPDVEFLPKGDTPYLYIEIPEATSIPVFIRGINVKVARCTNCKKELSKLPSVLSTSVNIETTPCQHCGIELNLDKLNWRRTAYSSSSTIIIHNIYESEAVPDDQLLDQLKKMTGSEWKYAYIRKV